MLNRRAVLGMAGAAAVGRAVDVGAAATPVAEISGPCKGSDPAVGSEVVYVGADGKEAGRVRIAEVVDSFKDFDPASPPKPGIRFVQVHVTVKNTGAGPIMLRPYDFHVQDDQGFLLEQAIVHRRDKAAGIPDLSHTGNIAPGSSVDGAVFAAAVTTAKLARVVWTPDSSRLIVVADLRSARG